MDVRFRGICRHHRFPVTASSRKNGCWFLVSSSRPSSPQQTAAIVIRRTIDGGHRRTAAAAAGSRSHAAGGIGTAAVMRRPTAAETALAPDAILGTHAFEVTDFIGSIWDKMKIKLGFTPDCLNGGTKRSSGMCVCRTYFSGDQCQKRECINNGTLTKTHKNPIKEVCLCPHPQYISGGHCEIVHCMNGGRFVNGSCLCVDNWYTGQFCEHYAASWFAVLGIPLVCIAVIAFCCVICRLDFCPKRNLATASSRSGTRHHRNRAHAEHRSTVSHNLRRPPSNPDRPRYHPVFYDLDDGLPAMVRENPLHSNQHICGLANYPEYNPALPAPPSSDDFKPIEPPPSYEQAVATCSTIIPATPVLQQRLPQTSHSNSVPPPPTYSPPRPLLAHQSSLSSTSDSSRTRGR